MQTDIRKVLQIDGGIGRVLCATPAIENLYAASGIKPDVITSWPEIFWNNPSVRKVYSLQREWLFDDVIRHGDYLAPDPYLSRLYYTQVHHLTTSFDYLINGGELFALPKMYLTQDEMLWATKLISDIKTKTGKAFVAAFQPFSATYNGCTDSTHRSLSLEQASYIASNVNVLLINCTKHDLDHPNVWWQTFNTREFLVLVYACDFIISVESSVAHLGAAYGKTGVEFFGATYPTNTGWPQYLNALRDGYPKSYYPNRFSGYVEENQDAMAFSKDELDAIILRINERNFENISL